MWRKILSLVALSALVCFSASGAAPKRVSKKKSRSHRTVNIKMRVDSVDWLRERYCDMLTYDPARAKSTMTQLQRNFAKLPLGVRDSLLAAQYGGIVELFEQERNERAYAFADCYYGLAAPDDPNLGTLYLNDIVLSIEQDDSVKLRQRITQLREYAQLNNLDYDTDLAEAEENMNLVRHRVKFRQTPVSEFCGDELWVLGSSLEGSCEESQASIPIRFLFFVPVYVKLTPHGRQAEISLWQGGKPKKNKMTYSLKQMEPSCYGHQCDTISKTMYCIWGHEQTRSANPQLLGSGRQLVQQTHAFVSGELAKKKYSYGKKLGGELAVSIIDAGLNALFDWLSVSTEYYYRCELSLTMVQPEILEGVMAVETVEVKSNQLDRPKTDRATFPVRYYKMRPKFNYCCMYDEKPICSPAMYYTDYEKLVEEFKKELPAFKERYKSAVKKYKAENPKSKEKFDMQDIYNLGVLSLLRELGEQSLLNHPKTQP